MPEKPATKVKMPELPLTGGCQCGQLRYSAKAAPYVFYLCHCTECQRHTSSAFGESLRFRADEVEVTGPVKRFQRVAESGKTREGLFCPECGVRVLHSTAGADMVNIKAGTLDDATWLVPAGHIWTRSKQRFVAISDDELQYAEQPDDSYAAMAQRWRAMLESTLPAK